jgi:hypothetical protein
MSGTAAAQPPTHVEQSPSPPDLPGVVVAQSPGSPPSARVEVAPFTDRAPRPPAALEPAPLAFDGTMPLPGTPVSGTLPFPGDAATIGAPCPAPAGGPGCAKRGFGSIDAWLMFRSRARQSGHYLTPYVPPLQAWFPCEPRRGVWVSSCAGVPGPLPCPTVAVPPPMMVAPGPAAPLPPGVPVSPETACPGPETDVLLGFKKVGDGLNFAPGVAPMSDPTKQLHRVSHWRPK